MGPVFDLPDGRSLTVGNTAKLIERDGATLLVFLDANGDRHEMNLTQMGAKRHEGATSSDSEVKG